MKDLSHEKKVWTWTVRSADERADVAILKAFEGQEGHLEGERPSLSRSQLKRLIDEGKVTSEQTPIKANQKLKPGSLLQIEFPAPQPTSLLPENRPIDLLFEDEHLVVVNKPPGLTVHPSVTQMEGTLVHALLHHIRDLSGIGGVLRPGIVHRIDKDTSGALVITKTDLAHQKLSETFAKHDIERCYWALCYGSPPPPPKGLTRTKIESLIGRSPSDRKKMSMQVKHGRKAITYFKKLEEYSIPNRKPFASWLEVTLETGRTHQVRVHLTGLGYSILGDPVYGTPSDNQPKWQALPATVKSAVARLPGQALHARVLGFKHPITQETLRFDAPLPPAFEETLKLLQENFRDIA
jgi:23S rRNA pseudouridine1911/1915/1917 synthase